MYIFNEMLSIRKWDRVLQLNVFLTSVSRDFYEAEGYQNFKSRYVICIFYSVSSWCCPFEQLWCERVPGRVVVEQGEIRTLRGAEGNNQTGMKKQNAPTVLK